jgi:hypothetical protein
MDDDEGGHFGELSVDDDEGGHFGELSVDDDEGGHLDDDEGGHFGVDDDEGGNFGGVPLQPFPPSVQYASRCCCVDDAPCREHIKQTTTECLGKKIEPEEACRYCRKEVSICCAVG